MDETRLAEADQLRYDGEYEQAITIYDELLAADGDCYLARYGRALCYCFTGLFDESIAELELVRDQHPDFIKGRVDLFKTYLMLGMNVEAKREMKAILRIDPNNEEVNKHRPYFPDFDEDDGAGDPVPA
ncbi:MAG: tetratricopeptide repeat protein [Armatimonadetes bacterium]|nr:tetratricopeptide repeat protein [Armatimonadota bacterium]